MVFSRKRSEFGVSAGTGLGGFHTVGGKSGGGRGGWNPALLLGGIFWSPGEEERVDQKRRMTH